MESFDDKTRIVKRPEAVDDLVPGDKIRDLTIIRELGQGAMGVVYLAVHDYLKTQVAVKVLPPLHADNPEFVSRFLREAETLAKLKHPNIVEVRDFGVQQKRYFLVLEFVDGGDIEELLASHDNRLPSDKVYHVLREMLQGLEYAHNKAVIHRDLKPANLLLDKENRIKISDFGLARVLGEDFQNTIIRNSVLMIENKVPDISLTGSTSAYLGTYDFMSPEARSGKPVKRRSDLYAVGVIAYYLLTGQKPLARSKPASALVKGLSPKWDRLIDKCLELNIEDRYRSAARVLEDLEALNPARRPLSSRLRVLVLLLAMAALGTMQLYRTYEEDFKRVFHSIGSPTGTVPTPAPGSVSGTEDRMNPTISAPEPFIIAPEAPSPKALLPAITIDPTESAHLASTQPQASVTPPPGISAARPIDAAEENVPAPAPPPASISPGKGPVPSPAYIARLDALRATAPLNPIEYEWINGALSNALDDTEANAARSLLSETIGLDQWRQVTRLNHDARESIGGWRRSNLISAEEGDWLEAAFWGDRGESERQHANDLLKSSTSVQQWRAATDFRFMILLPDDIEMEFIRVNGGRFTMGSPTGERGRLPWEKQRAVNIEAPIYGGVAEVTQRQFRAVTGRNPSFSRPLEGSDDLPVEQVSWEDIMDFLDQLTHHMAGLAQGRGTYAADIPTEEEWEYFARAGTTSAFNDGTDFSRGGSEPNMRAWINYNRSGYGTPVRRNPSSANSWGFRDVHGNVAEITRGREVGQVAVRGGSYKDSLANCRSAARRQVTPQFSPRDDWGFRVVLR